MADYLTNLTIANLTALFLQSILYGIYITTCGDCARALTRVNGRWKSRQEMQWPFLLAGGLLLINTTCSLSIELQRCIDLLVYKGPIQSVWIIVVKSAQFILQTAVGDLILIYRVFVVYRRNWMITAPFVILWLVGTGCACRALQLQTRGPSSAAQYNRWLVVFWLLSAAHDIMITLLLLYRLRRINRSLPGISSNASESETVLHRIMHSIAESGMLYAATVFIVLICQATNSLFALIPANAVVMVTVGITFNLILIRAKQCGNAQQDQRQRAYPQFTTIGPEMSSIAHSLPTTTVKSKM